MGIKPTLVTCGTCGKPRGLRHTCVTNATSRRRRRRTSVRPRLNLTCSRCGKPMRNPLTHTCTVRTDFKQRQTAAERKEEADKRKAKRDAAREAARARKKAAAARQKARRTEQRKRATQRRKDAAARRRAAEKARRDAARKPRAPRQPRHDYRTCNDQDCARYGCVAYQQGIEDCPLPHQG